MVSVSVVHYSRAVTVLTVSRDLATLPQIVSNAIAASELKITTVILSVDFVPVIPVLLDKDVIRAMSIILDCPSKDVVVSLLIFFSSIFQLSIT